MQITADKPSLDMVQLLLAAYEIGDMINQSYEVAEYLKWKQAVESSPEIQEEIRNLNKKKDLFAECERFGHFHPEYHRALEEVKAAEKELERFEAVRQYKDAEQRLDELLYDVSKTVAHAVSESIKVPSNNPLPVQGGCGSGGACRCG